MSPEAKRVHVAPSRRRLAPTSPRRLGRYAACVKCAGKHPSWGMSVSHSHRRTKRRWNPNITRVRALVSGSAKRINVCTGCIKSGKIVKAELSARISSEVQGVVKAYDPVSGTGIVMCDTDLADYDLAPAALAGSVLRMVRQAQRVIFDLDESGRATHCGLGSEVDMKTPDAGSLAVRRWSSASSL